MTTNFARYNKPPFTKTRCELRMQATPNPGMGVAPHQPTPSPYDPQPHPITVRSPSRPAAPTPSPHDTPPITETENVSQRSGATPNHHIGRDVTAKAPTLGLRLRTEHVVFVCRVLPRDRVRALPRKRVLPPHKLIWQCSLLYRHLSKANDRKLEQVAIQS